MIELRLSELASELNGQLFGDDVSVRTVSTDTRSLQPGDFFIALQGPNFDGNDYLDLAAQKQAVGAMVSRRIDHSLPRVQIADTRFGLGQLAAIWRQRARAKVVAVTGSNGKTTLKEMIAAILSRKGLVLATRGNLNNDIGLPLTLTRLQEEDFAVLELGANHPGEIDYLSRIARPDIAILNNAGRAHLEGFGSPEGVARAKAEIINGLPRGGLFIFNADDRFADLWRTLSARYRTLSFGVKHAADITSPDQELIISWTEHGFVSCFPVRTAADSFDVELHLAGEHNRMNALAAIAACQSLGMDHRTIQQGLSDLAPVPGRLCLMPGINGMRLVDDSYNANPDSVSAAIAVLRSAPGRRTLVLGDLAELGAGATELHAEIGKRAKAAGIDRLYSCGSASEAASRAFGKAARHFTEQGALIDSLAETVDEGDSLLVKGSRSARMDRVVAALSVEAAIC